MRKTNNGRTSVRLKKEDEILKERESAAEGKERQSNEADIIYVWRISRLERGKEAGGSEIKRMMHSGVDHQRSD